MALDKNSRLGPYEILAPLGAGGMGEVYRARDSRLNRDVAIKILREDVSGSPDRRSRFEKEARAVAALSHPNIVSIFDFGEAQGSPYTVSELIAGESLRSVLRRGAVPIRTLIDMAVQIAEGLSCAHAAGIVHRDLKPENIMVTTDGRVKILDFGLARQTVPAAKPKAGDDSTETAHMTEPGTILGTANYMSPEQAGGYETDYRGDQFSFGLLLYELACGKKAFSRPTTVETLAAIIKEEPPPLDAKLPAPLRWAMDRCLAKDPAQRYESTRDLYLDLRAMRDHFSEAYASPAIEPLRPAARKHGAFWKWVAIPALLLAAGTVAILVTRDVGADFSRNRYTPFAVGSEPQDYPAWSPDGKAIAWQGMVNGHTQLFVRYLNSPDATQLTHNLKGVKLLRWSPDSKRLLFIASRPDSTKAKPTRSLYSISLGGGEAEHLLALPMNEIAMAVVDVSPDLRTIAVFGRRGKGKYTVFIASPIASALQEYQPALFASIAVYGTPQMRFSADGSKVLLTRIGESQSGETWLLPLPPRGKSQPYRVMTHLVSNGRIGEVSWLSNNRHVATAFIQKGTNPKFHIWIADTASADAYQVTGGTGDQSRVDISPDSRHIVFSEFKDDLDIISLNLADGRPTKLIATAGNERMAAWSAKTPKLAYVTDRNGVPEIWMRTPDGKDHPLVTQKNFPGSPTRIYTNPTFSPDGEKILFSRLSGESSFNIWIMPLSTETPVRLNEAARGVERGAAWSPDGIRFAEIEGVGPERVLSVNRVGSSAAPAILRHDLSIALPDWSPAGDWITFRDNTGWNLISPDGKTTKPLGPIDSSYLTFSKDGKVLYGIQEDDDRCRLFSLDVATLKLTYIRDLDKDLAPASDINPGIRFSLSPDGKSITYSTRTQKSDLWLLEGFRQPGILGRLGLDRWRD